VKSDQDRSKDLDRRIGDVTADTERMQRQLVELEADLKQDRRGDIDPAKVRIRTSNFVVLNLVILARCARFARRSVRLSLALKFKETQGYNSPTA
jgi:hypothetical protein